MKNKSVILYLVIFVVLLGGAVVMYNKLAPQFENHNLISETESEADIEKETEENNSNKVKAVDFTVVDKEGNEVKLSNFIGKPVIVNFWASWCGPCKNEMPDFEEKYQKYKDEIHFLMINVTDGNRETTESAKNFISDSGYTFPVYFDTQLDASNTYGIYSLPTSLFIDAEGYGIAQATGMIDAELLQTGIDMIYNP